MRVAIASDHDGFRLKAHVVDSVRELGHEPIDLGVEHDDMNVLVLGGRVVGRALAHELVKAFLGARATPARSGTGDGSTR